MVLTPETAWSSRRMAALYGSTTRAALPADEVRSRTPNAPPGDAGPYVKRTTCDEADQFAFGGLADGAWYAITIVRPVGVQVQIGKVDKFHRVSFSGHGVSTCAAFVNPRQSRSTESLSRIAL